MKFNDVSMYGVVQQKPRLIEDDTGTPIKGILKVEIVRNARYTGDNSTVTKKNAPFIISEKPEIIEKIKEIEKNDTIIVRGVLVTESKLKKTVCPECGETNEKDGMIVYIAPIHISKIRTNESRKEALFDLEDNKEISNQIRVIGSVVSSVETPSLAMLRVPVTQYQLAIARTYRLNEDKYDYPWVKSFGDNARSDELRLRKGSKVMIDGYLRHRQTVRKAVCKCCGMPYTWDDFSMEIVPYETEYLANFTTKEDELLIYGDDDDE